MSSPLQIKALQNNKIRQGNPALFYYATFIITKKIEVSMEA
jgi:hypothetical protein